MSRYRIGNGTAEKDVLDMTDVEYRLVLERRLTRVEILNWLQGAAIVFLLAIVLHLPVH